MPRKKVTKTGIKGLFQLNNVKKLKTIAFYAIIHGLLINYMLNEIFHVPFNWHTFPAYGIFLYFLKSEFIYIMRWCFHKLPGVEE